MTRVEERLSDWLYGVSLDPDGSDLPAFNAAVTAAAASATPGLGVDFVASAYGLDDGAEAACHALAAQLPATPNGAVLTPGALLTRRLSAAVVAATLETRVDDAAKATGLAVAAADFVGLTPHVAEISQLAGNAVPRLARLARTPRALPDQRLKARVDTEMKTLPPADEAGALGFTIEASEIKADKIRRPVLFGEVGRPLVAYEVDGFHAGHGIVLEVKAGRRPRGMQTTAT
jgi:hypothetical protein